MKSETLSNPDPMLHKALRGWQVRDALPPRFQEQVWQRIAREEAQGVRSLWSQLLNNLSKAMLRPALAGSYLAVLLLGGLAAGYWHARLDNERAVEQLGARYVQMMDPYQSTQR